MLIVPNHHVIVPITNDIGISAIGNSNFVAATFRVDLFGDSILCGRDPDLIDPECGCSPSDLSGAVPQPPNRLLEVFLPQFKLDVRSKCSGLSTSAQLLNGTDGVNTVWPTNTTGDIVVINHGLNDCRFEVDVSEYKQNLKDLRKVIDETKEVVWLTPTKARGLDTNPYASAMRQVAAEYGDIVADANQIKDWMGELPDGTHPRQLGYSELVELCLAPAVNNAIVKLITRLYNRDTQNPYNNLRQDLQGKFVMTGERQLQLPFTPKSSSWVEVYHRDNISYRVVSRGYLDSKGILTSGIWNADTSQKLVNAGRSYNLSKIKRDRGDIIFSRTYDVFGDPKEAKRLANDLNQTNDDYIVVVSTFDEPRDNRLAPELVEAMYRCGASAQIFGSPNFKYRSSYILVGIPGIGQGQGHEAYGGWVDATEANIAPIPTSNRMVTLSYYPIMAGNDQWSDLLNDFAVWDENYHASLISVDGDNTGNIAGGGSGSGSSLNYYEGATALTTYWNNSTTTNMTVSGLGAVLMHGYTPSSTYTFTYTSIPAHNEIRYEVYWHFVDSADNETCDLKLDGTLKARFRKAYNQTSPTIDLNLMDSITWQSATYSYSPWGGTNNGYLVMDSGWIPHVNSTFTAEHVVGLDQAQNDEAVYFSHVRFRARSATSNAEGTLNYALTTPIARWVVTQEDEIVDSIGYPNTNTTTAVNTLIVETPDCKDLGIQFGIQGQSYLRVTNDPKLELTSNVQIQNFTIEAVVWPLPGGGGGMIVNKDSEYELRIDGDGTIWVALDWGTGTDVNLPGGGWYVTTANVELGVKSHIAWVVDGTQFEILVNGVSKHVEMGLDRQNAKHGNDLFIGNRTSLSDQFKGYIIDLRIWDRALSAQEFLTTKNYFEYTNIPFNYGVAPLLENFIPTLGTRPNDDLVIIGHNVTMNDLYTLGIYKTKRDVLTGVAGDEVTWSCVFSAPEQFVVGYWLWDARKYPTNVKFKTLGTYNNGSNTRVSGAFVLPPTFNEKSIIVFGVGDGAPLSPTGFSNVSLQVNAKRISSEWSGNNYYWDVFFPQPDEITFQLSTDNIGTLYIQKSPSANVLLPSSYDEVISVSTECRSYEDIQANVYIVPECGWYRIQVYAENTLDLAKPPTFYTGQEIISPTPAQLFMNTYGVSTPTNLFTWDVILKDNTVYTVELESQLTDAQLYIKELIDGVETSYRPIVSGVTTVGATVTRSFTTISGYHSIKITASTSVIVAARIRTSGGKSVWNTRSVINPRETDFKGVAAKATDRFNRTLWTTRSPINQKEFNNSFRTRTVDRSHSYSEIEFELSPHGTIIPVDIYPPRYEYLDSNNEIKSMSLTRDYDIVKNFPPVNGTRIVNHRYYSSKVATLPERYRVAYGNKIIFEQPMHGVITVVSDTLAAKNQTASELSLENTHSMDYYRKRFTPARWAPGSNVYPLGSTVFGQAPGSTGTVPASNTAPRVANSAVITNQIMEFDSIYNAGLNFRVGDSHYAEPVILSQPMMGYARLSQDRKTINYTPFAGVAGYDSFSYTLISQHGQEGVPKNVYVRILPSAEVGITVTPTKVIFSEMGTGTTNRLEWLVAVPVPGANVRLAITGGTTSDIDFVGNLLYATKSNPVLNTSITANTVITLNGDIFVRWEIDNDQIVEPVETVELSVISDVSNVIIASGTAYLQD